jgi:hypothetical protein
MRPPPRPCLTHRLRLALLAVLALLLPALAPLPAWDPARDDPFLALGGLCTAGHDDPGAPPAADHDACRAACQAAPVPVLPPASPALPLPAPLAASVTAAAASGAVPPRRMAGYASRGPPSGAA